MASQQGKGASDLLTDLTSGLANWISSPSTGGAKRKSSDSSMSAASSFSSDDDANTSGVSSPTDVTFSARKMISTEVLCSSRKQSHRSIEESISSVRTGVKLRKLPGMQRSNKAVEEQLSAGAAEPKEAEFVKPEKQEEKLWPCLIYGICACAIHLVNKGFFNVWAFKGTFLFSLTQAVITCSLFVAASLLGLWTLPSLSWKDVRRMMPLAVLSVCNSVFALVGLQNTVLPMYLVLRRMVTPLVLLAEFCVWGTTQPLAVVASLALLFLGSVVAGASDLTFDYFGYSCTMIANFFTVGYTMYMKIISKQEQGSAIPKVASVSSVMDIVFYNSLFSLPLLAFCSVIAGEWEAARAFPHLHSPLFQLSLLITCLSGLTYQASMVLSNTLTSPLATSIAGNLKDLLCSSVAFALFDSAPPTPTNVLGLVMSVSGALSYVLLKARTIAKE